MQIQVTSNISIWPLAFQSAFRTLLPWNSGKQAVDYDTQFTENVREADQLSNQMNVMALMNAKITIQMHVCVCLSSTHPPASSTSSK